jgi:AsmA protein
VPAREYDMKGVASLNSASGAPGFELPFVVQGPWDDPILLPDTQALIQRSPVASPLLNAVRNRNTRDTVRSAIERLTGGAISAPVGTPAADPKP